MNLANSYQRVQQSKRIIHAGQVRFRIIITHWSASGIQDTVHEIDGF
jgi:hypothetical protein